MKEKLRKIMRSRIFTLVGILLFIGACIGVGIGLAYVEHESDPTDEAVEYFRAFMQADYEKMYSMVDVEDGYYVNKNMYIGIMKNIRQNMVVESYEIKKPTKENGRKLVAIKCVDNQSGTSEDFKVYLNPKRKLFQIIPDYKINVDDIMVENFKVIVPKGNHLELNSEAVDDSPVEITQDKNGNSIYSFEAIVNGAYRVGAVNKYGAYYKNMNLAKNDTTVDLTKPKYTANEKYAKQIDKNANKIIKCFYQAVRNRDSEDKKLKACLGNDKKLKKKVKELVEESQKIIFWEDTKNIEKYRVTDFELKDLKNDIRYDANKKAYTVDYTYTYKYEASTDTALYTSYVYRLSGKCDSKMTLIYQLEKDNIVLSDIKIKNKNKKKE